MSTQTSRDLRRINRSRALREVYFGGPLSRLQIVQRTGMSQATVANMVGDLLRDKVVKESGSKESDGGRPTALLAINPDYSYIIGIDVGETAIQVSLFDLAFKELGSVQQFLSLEENQPSQVVKHIVTGVEKLLHNHRIDKRKVLGVGIGFPGIVNPEAGISVFAPNWGWHDVPIASILESKLDLPMALDNGAKAMARAESMFGAARGVDSSAVLLIGTGVGAGIIEGGSLYRGAMNSAGEIGHTIIQAGGRKCRCGNKGCLEAYVGAPNIIARYKELSQRRGLRLTGDQKEMVQCIISAAREGDEISQRIVGDTLEHLAMGVGTLINLVNPQRILIGGWVGLMLGDEITERLPDAVSHYALRQPFGKTEFGLCELKEEAVAQGAATLILERFLQSAGRPIALHEQTLVLA